MKKHWKFVWGTAAVLGGIGAAVHALSGVFDIQLLGAFGNASRIVQSVAGVSGLAFVVHYFTK